MCISLPLWNDGVQSPLFSRGNNKALGYAYQLPHTLINLLVFLLPLYLSAMKFTNDLSLVKEDR
jgi:hypothetical protein